MATSQVNPSIILNTTPPQNQLQTLGTLAALKNQQQESQLRTQQIVGAQQENAAKAYQFEGVQALNQAIASNTKPTPDGSIAVDHDGVVKALTNAGRADVAQSYVSSYADQQAKIAKLSSDQADAVSKNHAIIASAINGIQQIQDPTARQQAWQQSVADLTQKGILGPHVQLPAQVPDDTTLNALKIKNLDVKSAADAQKAAAEATEAATRQRKEQQDIDFDRQLQPGKVAEQNEALSDIYRKSASQKLSSPAASQSAQSYAQIWSALKPEEQAEASRDGFKTPDQVKTARDVMEATRIAAKLGMTPKDQADLANKQTELSQGDQRIGLERQQVGIANQRLQMEKSAMLTPEAQKLASDAYAATGKLPELGMGESGALQRAQIINMAAKAHPDLNMAVQQAQFQADSASLKQNQEQTDKINGWLDTAGRNMKQFLDLGQKVVDSGSPLLNKPLREIDEKVLGNDLLPAFQAAKNIQSTELAKITNGVSNSGTLTDAARKEVEKYHSDDITLKQALAVSKVLMQDAENRRAAMEGVLARERGRIGNPGSDTVASPGTQATPSGKNPQQIMQDLMNKHLPGQQIMQDLMNKHLPGQ